MILAAGLGTRLRPLTDSRPKALVEVAGRTLLEITLMRLRAFGVNEVIINVHHFADMVVDYLKSHNNFGMRIEISREDELLLDTGGGLKKAAWFFLEDFRQATASQAQGIKARSVIPSEGRYARAATRSKSDQKTAPSGSPDGPFLLHNVDVISTIDFGSMLQFHNEHCALATLAVQSRTSSRLLLFDDKNQLVGRRSSGKDPLIPGAARDPDDALAQAKNDQAAPAGPIECYSERIKASAFSSHSPLAIRQPPLPLAFSGIHVISPRLLDMLNEQDAFSIIDAYLRLAAEGQKILAFRADEYYWRDLGRPSDLSQAALHLQQRIVE
jgi:NDP-sugar pyrophosphorylase family protein